MENIVETYTEGFKKQHRRRGIILGILLFCAAVVIAVVAWQLHYIGVAMATETYCGYEEHIHDESCYETVLICGLEETESHQHDDSCYETEKELVCGLEESEEHQHDDSCYEEEQVLVCGLEESEGHIHDDSCYETNLVCELPEHTHTIECMIDETADLETAADWEATLPELTGNTSEDVVAIAESQLGYKESEKNFKYDEETEIRYGYTRYGAWYGNEYGEWDAMFASFCLNYAGVADDEYPEAESAQDWVKELSKLNLYEKAATGTPVAGGLVFLDEDEDGEADSVAVIENVKTKTDKDTGKEVATKISVIEGDYEDAVNEYSLSASDSLIVGYSSPVVTPLSEGIGDELDGDYAYLTNVTMELGENDGYAITTGTAPWDTTEGAGNDTTETDRILRTYDTAVYTVTMNTSVRADAPYGVYTQGKLYFEMLVEGNESEIQWETSSMGWLESKHGVYTNKTETYGKKEYQVLRGYIMLEPSTDDGHAIGETLQTLSISLRALAMQNEDIVAPLFTFFLAYNNVGLSTSQYNAWGTDSYNGPIITFEGEECDGVTEPEEGDPEAHGYEYHTIIAPEITISAAPRYNIAIVNSTASKTQAMGSYDFSTGNDLAMNKMSGNDTEYYGRLGGYGLVLQVVGKSEAQGLRGVQLPANGESISLSFTLDLSSTYTATDGNGKTTYETGTESNGYDLTKYAPLIWGFDENKTGNSQQDNRTIPVTTKYADQVPYNKLSNNSSYWYASCSDGGTWRIADNNDGTYTVTVTTCKIDMNQLPYVYPGAGTSLSYKYYNPNNINYSPNDDSKNNYWEVETACLSAGELWVVQPYYAGKMDDNTDKANTTYISQILGEGTFSVTLKDSNLQITNGDETIVETTDKQSVTSDDNVSQSMALVNPGSIDEHIVYLKYNYSAYNDALTDGCYSTAKDWILQGDKLTIEGYVSHDSAEEGNTGVAYDMLYKFDDVFFEPDGTVAHSGSVNSETRTDLWAAKADGTGWNHMGLSPDEDGYDSEMINATPDDLIYYSSLSALEADGKVCVGVLVQYRGLVTEQQNHLHTYIKGSTKMDAESDQVYMISPYGRAWQRNDLAEAMVEDPNSEYETKSAALSALLSMSLEEVNSLVNEYIPTRTATNTLQYENSDGTENIDYPAAFFINGDVRHPSTNEGGTSRTPTILAYEKTYYDEDGCHERTSGNYWGDSCLLVGYKSGLSMRVVQPTSGTTTSQDKSVFDMDTGQTIVDYEATPFITRNNGEGNDTTTTYTEVVVTITLPNNLSYIDGSSYIGGTYETNGEGKQGTVTGGVQLVEGKEITFTYEIGGKEYTITVVLTVTTDDEGRDVLIYTFSDVPVTGTEDVQYLENIFYSCEISSGAVKNGDELDVVGDIYCDSDKGIEPTMRDDGEAVVGITVTKNTAISLVKRADQSAVEVNDEIGYTIDIGDNSQNSMTMIAVDNIPYNGDEASTFVNEDCEVYVTEFSAYDVTETRDLSDFYFFYTTNKDYAGKTSADYPDGTEFVTGLGTESETVVADPDVWVLMDMDSSEHDTEGHTIYHYTNFPTDETVYVIVGIGIVAGNDDINMHVTLHLSNPDPGDIINNTVTQQHTVALVSDTGEVTMAYSDLSDSARVRVVGRSVSGYVWLDEDLDGGIRTGDFDAEQLLGGVDVELQIKDSSGNWVTAEKLKYADDESPICIATTDENGYYEFTYLPEGEYRVVVSGTGTGNESGLSYTLDEHYVTKYEAEGIPEEANNKVERSEDVDSISGIILPAASEIVGEMYDVEYQNAGYTKNIPFTVEKKWIDIYGEDITDTRITGNVTIRITATDGTEYVVLTREVELNHENDWTVVIDDIPYYDGTGNFANYTSSDFVVEEVDADEAYTVTVGDVIGDNDNGYSVTVTNQTISQLPKMGGSGTWMYTLAGAVLVAGAVASLMYRQKKRKGGKSDC